MMNTTQTNAIDTLAAELAAMDSQVVAKNGSMEWTRGELSALFAKVQNKENWKLPICAEVWFANDRELLGMHEAVIFFAGCKATITPTGVFQGRYRVKAAGYYATIGA